MPRVRHVDPDLVSAPCRYVDLHQRVPRLVVAPHHAHKAERVLGATTTAGHGAMDKFAGPAAAMHIWRRLRRASAALRARKTRQSTWTWPTLAFNFSTFIFNIDFVLIISLASCFLVCFELNFKIEF